MAFKDPQAITGGRRPPARPRPRCRRHKALVAGFLGRRLHRVRRPARHHGLGRAGPEDLGHAADARSPARVRARPDPRGDRRLGAADRQHGAVPLAVLRRRVIARRGSRVNFGVRARSATCSARCSWPTSWPSRPACITAELPLARLTAIATAKARRPRPTGRSSCAPSAATGSSAWPCGWRSAPRTSAARSWRSSSRSWPSWPWASTTSWRTCSSCRRRSSPTSTGSPGATRSTTGSSPFLGNLVGAGRVRGRRLLVPLRPRADSRRRATPGGRADRDSSRAVAIGHGPVVARGDRAGLRPRRSGTAGRRRGRRRDGRVRQLAPAREPAAPGPARTSHLAAFITSSAERLAERRPSRRSLTIDSTSSAAIAPACTSASARSSGARGRAAGRTAPAGRPRRRWRWRCRRRSGRGRAASAPTPAPRSRPAGRRCRSRGSRRRRALRRAERPREPLARPSRSAPTAPAARLPNTVSAHAPIDIGERVLKIRSMFRKRTGRPRSSIEQRRRRGQRAERDQPGDAGGAVVARQVAGQRHERRARGDRRRSRSTAAPPTSTPAASSSRGRPRPSGPVRARRLASATPSPAAP